MKLQHAVILLTATALTVTMAACSSQQQNSSKAPVKYTEDATAKNAPRKETGLYQADEMQVNGAGDQLKIYASLNKDAESFRDFVVEKGPVDDDMKVSLPDLGLEQCQLSDMEIICDDAFATLAVTYRFENGKVTADVRHKFR